MVPQTYRTFYFFLDLPTGILCAIWLFFFDNFGVHFDNIKTGTLAPEFNFLNLFPIFFSKKTNSWSLSPDLNFVKIDPKFSKKKNHVAHSIPDGRPRKK